MRFKNHFIGLLTLLLLSFCPLIEAQSFSTLEALKTNIEGMVREGHSESALETLKAHEDAFAGDPEFDYLLGTTALDANALIIAVQAFERAVLVQPNFAGAWLDLAITQYRLGDVETAATLIAHVEANFNPSESMRLELIKAKQMIQKKSQEKDWRVDLSVLGGHVKNANYGIASTNFQLTPIGASPINISLSSDYQPRSDQALELRAGASKRFDHTEGAYSQLQAALRVREYRREYDQDYLDLAGNWTYVKPLKTEYGLQGMLGFTARHILLGGRSLGSFINGMTGLRLPIGRCAGTARLELEKRLYDAPGQFDASIAWYGAGAECAWDRYSVEANYRYGWDSAEAGRPGGDTRREEMSVLARWQYTDRLQLRGLIYYADYHDQQGYSPLLSYGDARYSHRYGKRVEVNWLLPFDPSQKWSALLELEDVENRSNIALSKFKDTQIFLGLRYQLF